MLVSAIIPNYNHAAFLRQRIQSVLNQDYPELEVLILDDHSTDESAGVIEEYRGHPRVSHIIYNEQNSGNTFRQWLKGLAHAKGSYIWIAESDDFCEQNLLSKLMDKVIARDELDIAIAYAQSYDVDGAGNILRSKVKWTGDVDPELWKQDFLLPGDTFLSYLLKKNVIPNASACILKKDHLQQVLKDHPAILRMKMCGDWLTWGLISGITGAHIAFDHEHLNYFRKTTQSTRSHIDLGKRENRVLEELFLINYLKDAFRDEAAFGKRREGLIRMWYDLHKRQLLSPSSFKICPAAGIGKMQLLWKYLVYKIKRVSGKRNT